MPEIQPHLSAQDADQILVMDRGRIDDLLALGGIYARLCESSFLETREPTAVN